MSEVGRELSRDWTSTDEQAWEWAKAHISRLEAENKRLREGIEFIAGYAAGLRESLTHGEDQTPSSTEERA